MESPVRLADMAVRAGAGATTRAAAATGLAAECTTRLASLKGSGDSQCHVLQRGGRAVGLWGRMGGDVRGEGQNNGSVDGVETHFEGEVVVGGDGGV